MRFIDNLPLVYEESMTGSVILLRLRKAEAEIKFYSCTAKGVITYGSSPFVVLRRNWRRSRHFDGTHPIKNIVLRRYLFSYAYGHDVVQGDEDGYRRDVVHTKRLGRVKL